MKNKNDKRMQLTILVTVLGILAFGNLILIHMKNTGAPYISDLLFIIAAIIWFFPLWKGTIAGKKLNDSERLLEVRAYAKAISFTKVVCYIGTLFSVIAQIAIFQINYSETGHIQSAFWVTIEYLPYTLFLIIWAMIMPLYYKGCAYKECIMLLDGIVPWEAIDSYGYEKKGNKKKQFYTVELRIKSKNGQSSILPKIKAVIVDEEEKEALLKILDDKKIKRLNGI